VRSRRARTVSLVLALTAPTWFVAHTAQAPAQAPAKRSSPISGVDRLLTGRRAALVPGGAIDWSRIRVRSGGRRPKPHRVALRFPIAGGYSFGEAMARFGAPRSGHIHQGQDVFGQTGTPLVAVAKATVIESGTDGGSGNWIAIYSGERGETYIYRHMLQPTALRIGQPLDAGDRVGLLGCTGSCWGPHLHFEVRKGQGQGAPAIDPLPTLNRLQAAARG
jgi:murein DD-endopeptidase MepM/ murein hydrolase activator NlpD